MEIKKVHQDNLSEECWSVQIWGLDSCKTCEFFKKKDCGGKKIIKTGKNNKGIFVPIE
jgi:hypothetical protein